MTLDVPIHSPDEEMFAFEMATFFAVGPDSMKKSPPLAECMRRLKEVEAQIAVLEE